MTNDTLTAEEFLESEGITIQVEKAWHNCISWTARKDNIILCSGVRESYYNEKERQFFRDEVVDMIKETIKMQQEEQKRELEAIENLNQIQKVLGDLWGVNFPKDFLIDKAKDFTNQVLMPDNFEIDDEIPFY